MTTLLRRRGALLLLLLLAMPAAAAAAEGVVALDTAGGTKTLTYLAGRLDESQLAELKAIAPNVTILSGLSTEEALAQAAGIDGADAHVLSDELLAAAPNLRFVQSWSAGVDTYLELAGLKKNDAIVLANMAGVHGPAIAEHVFALLLALTRDLPAYLDAQETATWNRDAGTGLTALAGRTMFVVGMGGIGSEVAQRAKAFGMEVLATVRSARPAPAYVDKMGTAADLDRFLAEADVVVVALPLTDETRGLFDAGRFAKMKEGSYFVNIGRGPIVVTDALLDAVRLGRLAGVGLDVTDPEPLPADHPLWRTPRVIVTPHVSSRAELTLERRWELFKENLRRFGAGEPLVNVVDKKLGY
ncbi:MAG: D-2-hydroxyacid dehydrogenase [Krumholzibacteria bacterium]|nr:D-2-hydroxyacid dehydrogenase [Candidatus Krumholzibacteria bacterium]